MNRRQCLRRGRQLAERERYLRERYIVDPACFAGWNPRTRDDAAAYVGLLHAEVEHSVESLVWQMLEEAHRQSRAFGPHPVLVNGCVYMRSQMHGRFAKLETIGKRSLLESNQIYTLKAWEEQGAREYWRQRIDRNSGAGEKYLSGLCHPLGIAVSSADMKPYISSGVIFMKRTAMISPTELMEFVELRGSAMHVGTEGFGERIKLMSPQALVGRGTTAVDVVKRLCVAFSRLI
jgi:hypothetical protein